MKRMIITYDMQEDTKVTPWPIGLAEERLPQDEQRTRWKVTSGLGPDDGAILVGFGPLTEQRVTVFPEAAAADPASVVGLAASFSDGAGFFEWAIPVAELSIQ